MLIYYICKFLRGKTQRMQIKKILLTMACALLMFSGAAEAQTVHSRGLATYYGGYRSVRRTSNGEIFNENNMTCAHRTLPFGTMLKVREVSTGKEVVVRVTDRGPFGKGRIIDLTTGAARKLGMISKGVTQVEISIIGKADKNGNMEGTKLPEMQLYDPATGSFYASSEYVERQKQQQTQAKKRAAAQRKQKATARAKAQKPRWRVMNDKLTAKAGK